MTFQYVATYLEEKPDRPRGLAMWQREDDRLDMVAWDWIDRKWRSAPELVAATLFGDSYGLINDIITREEAERIAVALGIAPVPTDEEAMALDEKASRP